MRRTELAREYLTRVLRDAPGSKQAVEAQTLLDTLDAG
jgi:hypothetical protein